MGEAGSSGRRGATVRQQYVAYGTAIVLVVGGCIGVRFITAGDSKATGPTQIVASVPSPAGEITAGRYSDLLAEADSAIGTDFRRIDTDDPQTLATAAPQTAQTLYAEVEKLRAVTPPPSAAAVHAQLVEALAGMGDMIQRLGTDQEERSCPAAQASPYESLLVSGWANRIRADAGALAKIDRAFVFGKFLPPAPETSASRPKNGSFVKAPSRRGTGQLKIKNGGGDTIVSLVPVTGDKTPLLTVYVRAGSDDTIDGVAAGTYFIYYATGDDWNPARQGFMTDCAFSKFDDTFPFRARPLIDTWEITMTPVTGGNASTSDVDPNAFPSG
jgi:hypothetical protein